MSSVRAWGLDRSSPLLEKRTPSDTPQVFDDPSGRRARRGAWSLLALAAATAILALALCQSLVVDRWDGSGAGTPTVSQAGSESALLVLPFENNPQVMAAWLDTLRLRRRHAAFLVPGSTALRSPELLRRVLAEGHGVIAAPFSGQPPLLMGSRRLELELAATQLALAGTIGNHAALLRCASTDFATAESVELARRAQQRGAGCVTLRLTVAPPAAAAARAEASEMAGTSADLLFAPGSMGQASPAEATLTLEAALRPRATGPFIVNGLAPVAWRTRLTGMAWVGTLAFIDIALRAVLVLALTIFGVFLVRFGWVAHRMLARARRKSALGDMVAADADALPQVTVIVPAYNEEAVIVATVQSLLACRYPQPLQVIVVDDGSRDRTYGVAQHAFAQHPQVHVLTQPNGGKCAALNHGINVATTEIVVCIDADTQLDADALVLLCRHFRDPQVGAVAGNPKVGNRRNLLTRVQALEYVTLDSVERQAMEHANAITCITGALGGYRRELVQRVGGYTHDTLAEDTDMTLQILASGARVVYEDEAVAWTEAPETLGAFMRQRFRWMYGTVQAAFKHRAALGSLRSGTFGLVALPYLLLIQVGCGCLLLPLVDLTAVLGVSWLLLDRWVGWLLPELGAWLLALEDLDAWFYGLLAVTTLASFGMAGIALQLDRHERLRSLLWLLPMQLIFRVLLGITAYRCIARMLTGRRLAWGQSVRTGHVELPGAAHAVPLRASE